MTTTEQKPKYSGKAKDIFETDNANVYRAYFRDSATAFNGAKKDTIEGKGVLNATISAMLFKLLESKGIKTHFIEQKSERELLIKKVSIYQLEVIIRNITAGSLCKRLGLQEGKVLKEPIVEFSYKRDDLNDPLLNRDYILNVLEICDGKTLDYIIKESKKINQLLVEFFTGIGIKVVDFKLEFGKDSEGNIVLADELSPDNFRFWDAKTNEKLDKDRFRQGLGKVKESYEEMRKRIEKGTMSNNNKSSVKNSKSYKVTVQILPKDDILDPQGQAVEKSLSSLGYSNVKDLRVGKEIEFNIESSSKEEALTQAGEMCDKLLANPVIENYKIELE